MLWAKSNEGKGATLKFTLPPISKSESSSTMPATQR
jgi:signal transduction histidine kinase